MEAVLRKIDPENMYFGHVLLLLQRAVALVRHLAIPSKGGIHPISSKAQAKALNAAAEAARVRAMKTDMLEYPL